MVMTGGGAAKSWILPAEIPGRVLHPSEAGARLWRGFDNHVMPRSSDKRLLRDPDNLDVDTPDPPHLARLARAVSFDSCMRTEL